jgi:Big-like domain-containing protein
MAMRLIFFLGIYLLGCLPVSQAQIITTIAGNGTAGYGGDGSPATATTAEINFPCGIASDLTGNIYIADYYNVRIRKINTLGIITTIAGTGTPAYSGNGGPATAAMINYPTAVAADYKGNIYFNDEVDAIIRKIDAAGIITVFAGIWERDGFGGDGGPATAANLSIDVTGIATDTLGNVFISDFNNNRVRKIDTAGIITTVAGNGTPGYTGDGLAATNAQLRPWNYLAADRRGNLFIADRTYNVIRKVNAAGIISTYAGTGIMGYSGDGGPATTAELSNIQGLATDAAGNLFIADGSRIRKVSPAGIITTIAGGGTPGFTGDGGMATACELDEPIGLCYNYDCVENVIVADANNNRIRRIAFDAPPAFIAGHTQNLAVCRDAGTGTINPLLAITDGDAGQTEQWSLITLPLHGAALASYTATSTGGLLTAAGLSYTPATGYTGKDTFSVMVVDCSGIPDTTTIYVSVNDCALASPQPSPQVERETLQIFPNPNGGIFSVRMLSDLDEDVRIVVTDIVGERVKELGVRTNEVTPVAIEGAAGIYFLSAVSAGGVWSEKIVVSAGK